MHKKNKWLCAECKKQIPNTTEANEDPCVCKDYREQFAREGKRMHPGTFQAYITKRQAYLEARRTKKWE